jgi:hypothetical protein
MTASTSTVSGRLLQAVHEEELARRVQFLLGSLDIAVDLWPPVLSL